MCRRFTELRNITKGPCSLPNVEVSFCSGRCPSRTAVTPEVGPWAPGAAPIPWAQHTKSVTRSCAHAGAVPADAV